MSDERAAERLASRCSRYFSWHSLLQCGETFERLTPKPDTLPREPATWDMLRLVATEILDPLVEEFGAVRLTYAFAPPSLTRHIQPKPDERGIVGRRIAPRLDQHAACERNGAGSLICPRGGAAVDLIVPGIPTDLVAKWLLRTRRPVDRLYYYGADRPLHVSSHPSPIRSVVGMLRGPSGRRIPRRLDPDKWAALD